MKLSQAQLEWIVREVVRRLQASSVGGSQVAVVAARLTIGDRLVTTETLRGKLAGISQVEVATRAVVTPAVVDLLRDRQIILVRGTSN